MMTLLSLASAITAWAAMAVLCARSATQRCRMGLPDQAPAQSLAWALAGVTLLLVSMAAAVIASGASFGILLWLCQAGVLGLLMICLLPYAGAVVLAPWCWPNKG
ncbi:DUF3325 family protein [Massilia frigida]|nr:DUF3325 family protein [Massilia frigida]